MAIQQEHPVPIDISDELRTSFMDYAMSVIISRALPDVRDGLKPVHRRILTTLRDLNLTATRAYRKCAKIAGDVSGNYHPHGEGVVYPSLVRMAQDFSLRYPLVDGQGNFGCFTGDTKIKLLDGTEKSFSELAELAPDTVFHVYSVDKQGRIVIGEGRHARITRQKARIVELTLDNGEKIRCTPDHRFLLRDGMYKQAQELTLDDSLMPGYFDTAPVKDGLNDYLRVYQPAIERYEFVHYLADVFNAQRGLAREISGAFVRHHLNFNRWDNRPTNIERMDFLAHLHLHSEHITTLWQDEAFREAQRQGVQHYYQTNPAAVEERRARFIRQNQDPDFRLPNAHRTSEGLKKYYQDHAEARTEIARRMKALWEDPEYRTRMSALLTGIQKRPLTLEEKTRVAALISEKSRAMWGNDAKREAIVEAIQRAMLSETVRARVSAGVQRKWQDPAYRAKYTKEHFSHMAHIMWEDPGARKKHQEKIARQWESETFRQAQRQGVQQSNAQRMQSNPKMMAEVTAHASHVLREKWTTPEYRRQVMRQKIACYGSRLLAQVGRENLTPQQYELYRDAAWIPRLETALEYFSDWHELLEVAQKYNHRVVSIEWLDETADVYDITVDEHHNFLLASGVFVHNSIDGDPPAAMRYTEARMTRIGEEMLRDITKNTVDYIPNYDGTREEPAVLPSAIPNLLVNGSSGIAVGMATNIPPHNLTEVIDALLVQLDRPECTLQELMQHLPGPDFPTGGTIHGRRGIWDAYRTGRGFLQLRARCTIEESKRQDRESIIVTEIPYQVNKTKLLERIAEMVRAKKVEGIADLRDESDREGMRIVMDLKRDAVPQVVLNQLYANTQLQSTFGVIMLALVDNEPRILPLKELLIHFLEHRREVVIRRTHYDLERAREREHILAGLMIALDHIDAVIQLIRGAASPADARQELVARLALSETQAQAILDLRLQRLTGLEREKILQEHTELLQTIREFEAILASEQRIQTIVREELLALKEQYGDARRTEVVETEEEIDVEDLIAEEDMVVTKSHGGYIKRQPISLYQSQRRGGKGKMAMQTNEEDFVEQLFVASTHDYLLFFTNIGKIHWLKVYEIPQAGRTAKGRAAVNLLQLQPGEKISTVVPIRRFEVDRYLIMATKNGIVKKTDLTAYGNPRQGGIIALTLDDGDELISVGVTHGDQDIFLGTRQGYALRFNEADARSIGRTARGVIGIRLEEADEVIGMEVLNPGSSILTVSASGYGKRTSETEYRAQGRGGKGLINLNITPKTGLVVSILQVFDDDDIMVMSDQGNLVRLQVADIRRIGRNTQGVRLINLAPEQRLVGVVRIAEDNTTPTAELPIEAATEDTGDEISDEDFGEEEPPPAENYN